MSSISEVAVVYDDAPTAEEISKPWLISSGEEFVVDAAVSVMPFLCSKFRPHG